MSPDANAALLAAIHELTDEVRALRLLHEEGPEAAERRMRRARKAREVEAAAKRAVEESRRAEAAKADAVLRAAGVDPDAAFEARKTRERARLARELRRSRLAWDGGARDMSGTAVAGTDSGSIA